jgi:hypothetical protein
MCIFSRSLFVHLSFFFWPLCCLSLFELWLLISTLVSSNFCLFSFVHCIACPSATYSFWLPLLCTNFCFLFILAVALFELRLLITPLYVQAFFYFYFGRCIVRITVSDYLFGIFIHFFCCYIYTSPPSVLDTALCDTVCQWLTIGRWFSPGTLVSSTNKSDRHAITEILLKVAFNPINHLPRVWQLKWG